MAAVCSIHKEGETMFLYVRSRLYIYDEEGNLRVLKVKLDSSLIANHPQLRQGTFYVLSRSGFRLAFRWKFNRTAPRKFLEEAKIALLVNGSLVVDREEWVLNDLIPCGIDLAARPALGFTDMLSRTAVTKGE